MYTWNRIQKLSNIEKKCRQDLLKSPPSFMPTPLFLLFSCGIQCECILCIKDQSNQGGIWGNIERNYCLDVYKQSPTLLGYPFTYLMASECVCSGVLLWWRPVSEYKPWHWFIGALPRISFTLYCFSDNVEFTMCSSDWQKDALIFTLNTNLPKWHLGFPTLRSYCSMISWQIQIKYNVSGM